MPTSSLRPFLPEDISAATTLWQRTPGVGLSDADAPDALVRFLDRNPGLSHVAVQNGELVGTVLCGHDGRRGLIHHLVVDASLRREKLASRLLSAALAGLKQDDITKTHLLVFKNNELGLSFWRRHASERHEMALFSVSTTNS